MYRNVHPTGTPIFYTVTDVEPYGALTVHGWVVESNPAEGWLSVRFQGSDGTAEFGDHPLTIGPLSDISPLPADLTVSEQHTDTDAETFERMWEHHNAGF